MSPIKAYLANGLVGKKVHIKCDCLMNIDFVGIVKDYNIYDNEIVWDVYADDNRLIRVGENHPNMEIEIL